MVRIPASFRRAGFAGLSGSGQFAPPHVRPIRSVPIGEYVWPVTVDIGNDGVAPTVTFTGAGTAYALCGPEGLGQHWAVDQCYLATSIGALDVAEVVVYVGPWMGPATPVQQYAATSSIAGGGAQFGMGGYAVPDGWYVQAYWTGGTAGATAQLRVTGRKTVLNTL